MDEGDELLTRNYVWCFSWLVVHQVLRYPSELLKHIILDLEQRIHVEFKARFVLKRMWQQVTVNTLKDLLRLVLMENTLAIEQLQIHINCL